MAVIVGPPAGDGADQAQRRFRPVALEPRRLLAVAADDAGADVAVFFYAGKSDWTEKALGA
jgi:hypothetical protein